MISWGNVPVNSVLPFFFDAFDGGTGASITLTGIAIGDVKIFKGTSMTERSSTAGIVLLDTDGIDVDLITGIHGFSIDTGDNTDAGFYAVGSFFTVVVASVTIDAQTVNFVAGTFRLMAAEGVAGVPDVNTTHISDTAQTANDVGADVNDILVDTAVIGALGAGLTAVPWNAAWDAEVQSEVQDALDGVIADSTPTAGNRPSISQAALLLTRILTEMGIVGTTMTIYKEDGITAVVTLTLDSSTSPTAISRTT